MSRQLPIKTLKLITYIFSLILIAVISTTAHANQTDSSAKKIIQLSLEECMDEAMQNNRRRPISRYAVKMAEARHEQALASYWPQISAQAGYKRLDEPMNFIFPSSMMTLPIGMSLMIPEQDVQLMDEDNYRASLNTQWLLYDGGMRSGHKQQAEGQVSLMQQEARRTDLEIMDSVRRLYWGAVLARQLRQVGEDTLARMEATLNLTETMYKEGSGTVKKTDWLSNKVMVETIRAMVATLEKNEAISQAALANTMGMEWNRSVNPTDTEIPFTPFMENLEGLITTAYEFNPDWGKLAAGLQAAEGALTTAQSGHFPKLALTGEVFRWWNDYDTGYATDQNKEGWSVGIGLEIPIFSGMMTQNRIAETRAQLDKLKEQKLLLKEGIGLQVRDTFLSMGAAEKSHQATLDAMQAASENRDLNTRAYQNELVETEDVITAQLMEALMSAQHYKARYDHAALHSKLNLVVGTEVLKQLQ